MICRIAIRHFLLRNAIKLILACVFVLFTHTSFADTLLLARSTQGFPEAMSTLQNAITKRGYKISNVQRVDEGLKKSGYQSDNYRVVFFGKADEIRNLSNQFPELIPYIPLNFAIFAEGTETLVTTLNPSGLKLYFPDPKIATVFNRWEKDLKNILSEIRRTK